MPTKKTPTQKSPAAKGKPIDPAALLASLQAMGSPAIRRDMAARYGITGKTAETAFGVRMAAIQKLAKDARKSSPSPEHAHAAALALWDHDGPGRYESRMIAAHLDVPALVTAAQMDRWCRDFDNWAITDTVCFKLFDQVAPDLILRKIDRWSSAKPEFERRAGFALLACAALHNDAVTDADLKARFPLLESSTDDRNFVKKAVSWALRAIATRKPLRADCRKLAARLAASDLPAPRWTGKDALRALK